MSDVQINTFNKKPVKVLVIRRADVERTTIEETVRLT